MKRFDGLVLCSDIDGTLVDNMGNVPKENIEAIKYFRENGGKFTLVTGRVPEGVYHILSDLEIDYPCVCHNGCSIYDFNGNKCIEMMELSKSAVMPMNEIMKISPESGVEIMTSEGIYVLKNNGAVERHLTNENLMAKYINTVDEVDVPWIKILFAQMSESDTDKINRQMKDSVYNKDYSIIKSHMLYYEIFNKNAGKGAALKKLCESLKIDLKNVVAIGDSDTDISMISIAGIGAAVENASENVKNQANIITCENNKAAVSDLISKL